MQIVETIELISINGTLIFQLISFLVFLFFINRIMLRPLQRQAGERKTHLDSIASDIAAAQKTCDELDRQMIRQEEDVRQMAVAARDELEAAGKKTAADLLNQARQEISDLRSQGQKENETQIAAARKDLGTEAEKIAHQMMVSLLGRRIEI